MQAARACSFFQRYASVRSFVPPVRPRSRTVFAYVLRNSLRYGQSAVRARLRADGLDERQVQAAKRGRLLVVLGARAR